MAAPVARRQDYDYLVKLLLIGDSGEISVTPSARSIIPLALRSRANGGCLFIPCHFMPFDVRRGRVHARGRCCDSPI